jgi:hypothetical protein
MRTLEAEEAELRAYLLEHPNDRVGEEHIAVAATCSHKRIDRELLVREVDAAIIKWCTAVTPVSYVRLKERSKDAA